MRAYRHGLAAALTTTALPYGYALTVWSTGEFLRRHHHKPTIADIFLFVVGAAAGFGSLRVAVGDTEERRSGIGRHHILRAGAVHLVAITGAAATAFALSSLPGTEAWPLAPFTSTLTYLAVVALEQAFEV